MLREYIYNPSFFGHLIVWVLAGLVSPFALIPIVFLSNSIWFRDDAFLEVVLGLFFITLLSDSRNFTLAFAQSVKPIHALIVFFFFYLKISQFGIKSNIHNRLWLYILIAGICLFISPIFFESLQKTFSYFLIIFLVPNLLIWDWEIHKARTVRNLSLFLMIILFIGLLAVLVPLPLIDAISNGRFVGLFGNPNGVGVFAFLVIIFVNIANYYYPKIFSKKEIVIIYVICIISILYSGSRGALLSAGVFLAFRYFGYKFKIIAFILLAGFVLSFEYALEVFADMATNFGLEQFLRLDTIESGSGRLIAREFAWQAIQDNYWLGLGIGYGDYLFNLNYRFLSRLGHQGQVHNAFLNAWLDVGLIGLIAFIFGWARVFYDALKNLKYAWAIIASIFVSINAESWIVGSLSPWIITFLSIMTLVIYMKPEPIVVVSAEIEHSERSIEKFSVKDS